MNLINDCYEKIENEIVKEKKILNNHKIKNKQTFYICNWGGIDKYRSSKMSMNVKIGPGLGHKDMKAISSELHKVSSKNIHKMIPSNIRYQ